MEYQQALEQYLYKEWESARKRSELHKEVVNKALATGGDVDSFNVEVHERLAQLEWQYAVSMLEIILDFEKEKES